MKKKFHKIVLLLLAIPKTLYFNFKYFNFKKAIKFPVIVSHRVWLSSVRGKVFINSPRVVTGMIRIGFGEVGIFDQHKSRSIWQVSGKVSFNGKCSIGHGSKISIADTGFVSFGENFIITAESSIICYKNITFGSNTLISWDTLIMDTDFHHIKNFNGEIINVNKPVEIGNNVWIGCRTLILKGAIIPNNSVIAANTTVTKKYQKENTIIGGNPSEIIKEGIEWSH